MTKLAVTTEPIMLCRYCQKTQGLISRPAEAGEQDLAVRAEPVADRVLHPGVGGDDEEAGEPGAGEDQEGGEPVGLGPEALLPEEEDAQEAGLEEEGEHAFHGEGLADHAAGGFGEARPVGAELELHGDAGDHAHGEIDGEDFGPEAGGAVVVLVAGAQRHGLEDQDQQRQSHGELREEVVKRHGEGEVQAVNSQRVHRCRWKSSS